MRDLSAIQGGVGAADRRSHEAPHVHADDRALLKDGLRVERRLDLPQLDPVAAALDLRVDPAEDVDEPVLADVSQITGSVQP